MKLLALDTSTEACSVAMYADGAVFAQFELTPRAHTQLILPMLETVLAAAQLSARDMDAIVVGRGPGAFTGIRIGVGVAQGLALALDKPLIAVSTLAALAQQAYQQYGATQILTALDARMNEVYWGRYTVVNGLAQLDGDEHVLAPEHAVIPASGDWCAMGHGWAAYESVLTERFESKLNMVDSVSLPAAEWMLPLAVAQWEMGQAQEPELIQPVYLRNKIALTIQERQAQG